MTENALIPIIGSQPDTSLEEFKKEVSSSAFLPRIQIIDPKSKVAMNKLVPSGNYGLVRAKDDADDLTDEIDIVICAWRWKALDLNGENPLVIYDKDSDAFKEIQTKSEITNSKCMWGPEFLIWISSVKQYATYFCSGKTSRKESEKLFKLMQSFATLKVHLIETKNYSWYGPIVLACSTPFDIPPVPEIQKQVDKFRNPEVTEEPIAEGDGTNRER